MLNIIKKFDIMFMVAVIVFIVIIFIACIKRFISKCRCRPETSINTVTNDSSIFRSDIKILEENDKHIDDDDHLSFDDGDDEDYYKLYMKYKQKCIDFKKSNIILKKESNNLKQIIIESEKKKELMKTLIRKLDSKLKRKNTIIADFEGKILHIDKDKAIITELTATIHDLRHKIHICEKTHNQSDLHIKIKSLYRSMRSIFLVCMQFNNDDSMKFNDDISIDNPICHDIEQDEPLKVLTYTEKMITLIIKNSRSDMSHIKSHDDISPNNIINSDNNNNSIIVKSECENCDNMKSNIKNMDKNLKMLQHEVVKSHNTELFVNNIEYLLSMYRDDMMDDIVKDTDNYTIRHESILKSVGTCFKKWC